MIHCFGGGWGGGGGPLCSNKNTVLNVFFILCKQSYASISDGVCNTMEHNLKYNFYIDFQSLFKVATEK